MIKIRIKQLIISILIIVLVLTQELVIMAMNTGFSTEEISADRQKDILESVGFSVIMSEPEKRAIQCFDVNEEGFVAIGYDDDLEKIICVYKDEQFIYGIKFIDYGSFGLELDKQNVIVYSVRGHIAVELDANAKVVSMRAIQDNIENSEYWREEVFSTKRTVGGTEYVIKNDMGIFNFFAVSYSQLVAIKDGEETIIHDVNTSQLIKMIIIIIGIITFVVIAILALIKEFKRQRKKRSDLKKQITISEVRSSNGSYSIWISNIRAHQDAFRKINNIINHFVDGKELYFGHYKIDGMNMSRAEMKRYSVEIPEYFEKYGRYHPIVEKPVKKGKSGLRHELTVGSAPNNEETYAMIEKIFQYYLETIVFSPKIDWDTFVDSYSDYMNGVTGEYVLNGYTDFLFAYVDSGDFCVSFNMQMHEPEVVRSEIERIVFE